MKKAFTLFEVLIVVAIISIMAAMIIPMVQRVRGSSTASYRTIHRHANGTEDVYYSRQYPANYDGSWRIYTTDARVVSVSGDVTIEEIRK